MKKPIVITVSGKARHGKDTTATMLKDKLEARGCRVFVTHYADFLKFMAKEYFGWDGQKDEKGRNILQYLGTDKVRNEYPDFWVAIVEMMIYVFRNDYDYFIIPDARFPNEIDFLKRRGWNVVSLNVVRKGFKSELTEEQKNHASETALDGYKFDYTVKSVSGLEALDDEVNTLIDVGTLLDWF